MAPFFKFLYKLLLFIIGPLGLVYLTIVTPYGFWKIVLLLMCFFLFVGACFKVVEFIKSKRNEPPVSKKD